ncbi:hypothetical protein QQ008_11300 [Fulvivirgaceae bacterium BMA10]|uniref:N-acetyltransferase n=1 Tax=Splendidivirga corallicola TaxID=3051826 RepID=A0ABT8KMJ0_9BACT|nr:hypothetical protein [Fulvivirgaceae bacterium BMA10]
MEEISTYQNEEVVRTMTIKIKNYHLLKTESPESDEIMAIRASDTLRNDFIDTSLVKEVYHGRVDFLITEDRGIHRKAVQLQISEKVFTIDSFLEKVITENPDLKDYQVLATKKEYFGNININDPFFDSFKEDYKEFENWYNRKSDTESYVCVTDGSVKAFLYVKVEGKDENYSDITPKFQPKKRLKIGTFKVLSTGYKLGERFLKIIFDNALRYDVNEIYVTIFKKRPEQERLINLLMDWGFVYWGEKSTENGIEQVYVRDFTKKVAEENPKLTYPFLSKNKRTFIVPIYPEYHTNLFPDSYLNNESPRDYSENEPHRNAIKKVYISRSLERNLSCGDSIVFYRTKFNGPAYHTSVVTTLGIVENVITNIRGESHFLQLCRKRSVFSDVELKKHWNYKGYYGWTKPFILNFLYVDSFPMPRLNLKRLTELNIIEAAPRGFEVLEKEKFETLIKEARLNESYFID